jgi:chromosome segregation ATPase
MQMSRTVWAGLIVLSGFLITGCAQNEERMLALEEENSALREQRNELDVRLAVATEKTQESRTQVQTLQEQIELQIRELASLSSKAIELQDKLDVAHERLTEAGQKLQAMDRYRTAATAAEDELSQSRQELRKMRQQLAQAQDTAMTRVEELEAEIARLHDQLKEQAQQTPKPTTGGDE